MAADDRQLRILIVGAGVGGLTAALSLHAAGFSRVTLLEAARDIRELGVGLNLPPHAVRELTELGLGDALRRDGVETAELAYHDRRGELIWAEPRGLAAGYRWPQYSIHRGRLQRLLVDAVRERLGPQALLAGQRACAVDQDSGVPVRVRTEGGRSFDADVCVIADGIRSVLRDSLHGAPVPLATNGWVMYRGATEAADFLSGRSMVIVGDETQRIVVYPIAPGLQNWLLVRPASEGPAGELGNWNLPVAPARAASFVHDWRFDWLDMPALVGRAAQAYEYPMADIDPLPRWRFGRCVLLGDAAHAMYPFGSNGASQAILDARVLAFELWTRADDIDQALSVYESGRRETTASVQLANRRQAGDVMKRVSELARRAAHLAAADELKAVEQRYKLLAGFDVDTLNSRASLSVPAAQRAG